MVENIMGIALAIICVCGAVLAAAIAIDIIRDWMNK